MKSRWILTGILLISSLGCSHQWRDADLEMSRQEVGAKVFDIVAEIQSAGQAGSVFSQFSSLLAAPESTIYFADGPSPLGPVWSVFSVLRTDFLGFAPGTAPSVFDFSQVQLAFVSLPGPSGYQVGLMVDYQLVNSAGPVTRFFVSDQVVQVEDGEFVAILRDQTGVEIVLRSFDVDEDGELKNVIQLKLSDFDVFGNEQSNGKITTLVGFGP